MQHQQHLEARVAALEAHLSQTGRAKPFLVSYLSLWSGPLAPVSAWLEASAAQFKAKDAAAALLLRVEAQIEARYQRLLAADLGKLATNPAAARLLDSWTPNAAVQEHMYVRTTLPSSDPMIIVVLDRAHARLDRSLSAALLRALEGQLPADACGYIRARAANAAKRERHISKLLDSLRARPGGEQRIQRGELYSEAVLDTYLGALESFTAPTQTTGSHLRVVN